MKSIVLEKDGKENGRYVYRTPWRKYSYNYYIYHNGNVWMLECKDHNRPGQPYRLVNSFSTLNDARGRILLIEKTARDLAAQERAFA